MSNFDYSGPNQQYSSYVGNDESIKAPIDNTASSATYASLPSLENSINSLSSMANDLLGTIESNLSQISIDISGDNNAVIANAKTFPLSLGVPSAFITYNYYKYLETLNTASGTYLRNAYEQGVRDIDGDNSIDLLPVVQVVVSEVGLINDFISNNITALNDSSEARTVESFQDWCSAAITQLQNVQLLLSSTSQTYQLSDSETNLLSTQDATNTQALFKVNLNQLNVKISQGLQTLRTNFGQFASVFYSDFFQPALNFRQNVTSQILPIYPGKLGAEIQIASNTVNKNMNSILTDQLNRLYSFNSMVFTTLQDIEHRDAYRYFIHQLSSVGSSYTGLVTNNTDSPQAVDFFSTVAQAQGLVSYDASHQDLDDRQNPLAHTQYLLNSGDTLSGNLNLGPGITIDGVIPSTHIHTGNDGSKEISALYYNPSIGATPNHSGVYDNTNERWVFYADQNGQPTVYGSWATYSSVKFKKNVNSLDSVLAKVNELNPVEYHYINDQDFYRKRHGLLAEELKEVFPNLVISDNIVYEEIIPIIIKAFQELSQQVKDLKNGR